MKPIDLHFRLIDVNDLPDDYSVAPRHKGKAYIVEARIAPESSPVCVASSNQATVAMLDAAFEALELVREARRQLGALPR